MRGHIKYLNRYDSKDEFLYLPLKAYLVKRIDDQGQMKISLMINIMREFWSDGFLAEMVGISPSGNTIFKDGGLKFEYNCRGYVSEFKENSINLKEGKGFSDYYLSDFALSTSEEIFGQDKFLSKGDAFRISKRNKKGELVIDIYLKLDKESFKYLIRP